MNIDPNIVMAIIAVVTVVTPLFTTWQNNRFQLKLKKLENEEKLLERNIWHKRDIFENYACSLSQIALLRNDSLLTELGKYYSLAYIYAPPALQTQMSECQKFLIDFDFDKAVPLIDPIISDISTLIESQYK